MNCYNIKMRYFIASLVFIFGICPVAFAQETDDLFRSAGLYAPGSQPGPLPSPDLSVDLTKKLTLEDAIRVALENSPKYRTAYLNLEAAQVNVNVAKSDFLPTVTVGASQNYSTFKVAGSPTHDGGNSSLNGSAQLTLSALTEKVRAVKIQKLAQEQAELAVQNAKNDIIRSVKKAYYVLAAAQRAVEIRTKSRDLYKEQYERTTEYFRLGLRPKVDVTTAEVNLNNERLRLIRAENAVKTASASLANVMGITTKDLLTIKDIASFETFTLSFDEAVETAYANRPDVHSAATDAKIGQIRVNQARAAFFPTFTFSAGFNKYGDDYYLDNEESKLMASVSFPIFNAFKTYNSYQQAKINMAKTLNSNRSLLNDVFLEVQRAYINMQEAAESIPIAELNVEKARENLDLSQGRYNEGIGDILELKDAEVAYTDAELSLLSARYDYASALADLKQAMGTN